MGPRLIWPREERAQELWARAGWSWGKLADAESWLADWRLAGARGEELTHIRHELSELCWPLSLAETQEEGLKWPQRSRWTWLTDGVVGPSAARGPGGGSILVPDIGKQQTQQISLTCKHSDWQRDVQRQPSWTIDTPPRGCLFWQRESSGRETAWTEQQDGSTGRSRGSNTLRQSRPIPPPSSKAQFRSVRSLFSSLSPIIAIHLTVEETEDSDEKND